jgi:hypothetical protein
MTTCTYITGDGETHATFDHARKHAAIVHAMTGLILSVEPIPANTFTVLLMRPDYIAGQYGEDTYLAHVTAPDPTEALAAARREVAKADGNDEPEWNDYTCLCIFEGTHDDLNPEI